MRALILSSLFAIGLGLAGASAANAAPVSNISAAVAGQATVDQVQYYRGRPRVRCHNVRVCRMTPYGRRCRIDRVCRRAW